MTWLSIGIALILTALALAAGVLIGRRRAAAISEEQIQQEVVAHLARAIPSLTIAEQQPREIKLKNASGEEATMYLDNLIASIRSARGRGGVAERERIYGEYTQPLALYAGIVQPTKLAEQTDQIMPRLVHREYLDQMKHADPVNRRIGQTPLHVAYVLDEDKSVRYITSKDLDELKLTIDQLDELAMKNFRPKAPEATLREIMAKPGKAAVISSGDSYDATRVLLLPDYLKPGEVLAVAVPDRDTVVIIPQPDDNAWAAMEKVAAKPITSRVMMPRPLRITNMGIEVR